MAKKGKGTPYLVQALQHGPADNWRAVVQQGFIELSADISKIINEYSTADWPMVAAALSIVGAALKADLPTGGKELVDDFMADAQAVHFKVRSGRGGVSNFVFCY